MSIDLGYKAPDYGAMHGLSEPAKPSEIPTKTCYPEFAVPNNVELAKSLTSGQKVTATVELYVTEIRVRDRAKKSEFPDVYDGTRVEFEVRSMTLNGVKVDEKDADEESGKEAIQNFFSKKKKDEPEE